MKKILIILTLIAGLVSCQNQDQDFPDFDFTAGYFPYQYPVRTLVLGDYIYPNENDNNHKFLISTAFGGVYSNMEERKFTIALDESLVNNVLYEGNLDTIRILPSAYYTLSSNEIIIPPGKVNAGVEVQLNDAFFDDSLAIIRTYVVPLRITSVTNLDSLLTGKPKVANPDPRVLVDWEVQPKDFTMFAIKFINPYHGKYFHRGISTVTDETSTVVETNVYRTKYVEHNNLMTLTTSGRNQVYVESGSPSDMVPGMLKMNLTFSDDGTCIITEGKDSDFTITGSGKFVSKAEEWGLKPRDVIHINYQFENEGLTYSATDTLVIRDRMVKMETYRPVVFKVED
jgi:hypothetical protein